MRVLISIALLLMLGGCREEPEPTPPPSTEAPTELTTVDPERTDLLFRYVTEDGPATATTIDEIPAAARKAVHVIDLSKSPEARNASTFVQVFDLSQPGAFSGRWVPRDQLEAALAKAQVRPAQAAVIMYSASWCGVCKKAKAFMTKNKIAFVEKDIEKDPKAARELAEKAKKAGVSTNGVPVFDVGGRIIGGFDPNTLLKAARGG